MRESQGSVVTVEDVDPLLRQRQQTRAAGLHRLRSYTKRIVFGAFALAATFSVLAAASIPGHAGSGTSGSGAAGSTAGQAPAQTQAQGGQSQFTQNSSFGGGFFGSGSGGAPIAVSGGS